MRASLSTATMASFALACSFDTSTPLGDDAASSAAVLVPTSPSEQSSTLGGAGGSAFGPISCPTGAVLVGFDSDFYDAPDTGAGFCEVRAVCAKLLVSGTTVTRSETELVPQGAPLGNCEPHRRPMQPMVCPDNGVVVGLAAIRSGLYNAITEVELRCGAVDATGFIFNRAYSAPWGDQIGIAGPRLTTDCTDPALATGIYGGLGIVIDALGLECQSLVVQE